MSAPGPVRAASLTRDDWETPDALYLPLDREFNFTLDAAASGENTKCEQYRHGPCTGDPHCQCGICLSWLAISRVWCNPPYGPGLMRWCDKFARASALGATVVALLPANTDTAWFAKVYEHATELRFLTGRVNFVGTSSGNTGGSVLAIYRPAMPGLSRPRPTMTLWDWRRP